jgi:TATA-box binding protein (TBP) (component of TFIID and TFIIIB)
MYTFRFQSPKNAFLVFQSTKYRVSGDDFVKSRVFRKCEKQPMYVRRFSPVIVPAA